MMQVQGMGIAVQQGLPSPLLYRPAGRVDTCQGQREAQQQESMVDQTGQGCSAQGLLMHSGMSCRVQLTMGLAAAHICGAETVSSPGIAHAQ